MSLNTEHVMLLVDRLRATPPCVQGYGRLASGKDGMPQHMCPLGIACDLYRKRVGGQWLYQPGGGVGDGHTLGFSPSDSLDPDWSAMDLPNLVKEWYGFDSRDPEIPVKKSVLGQESPESGLFGTYIYPVTTLNDDFQISFPDLADALERMVNKEQNNVP